MPREHDTVSKMAIRVWQPLALCVAAFGCGGGEARVPSTALVAAAVAPAGAPRTATVSMLAPNGRPFPHPLVRALIHREPTWLLVDTGATAHVLADWLVEAAQLETTDVEGDEVRDHVGAELHVRRVVDPKIWLTGLGEARGRAVALRLPEPFRALGIGGILSPQLLGGEGSQAVLDLRRSELRIEPLPARDRMVESSFEASWCEVAEHEGIFLLRATINERQVTLAIDSGAERTSLLSASAAAVRLEPDARAGRAIYTASGRHRSRMVPEARLRVGTLHHVADIEIVPGSAPTLCPRDGVVGMSLIRACTMAMHAGGLVAECSLGR